MAFCPNCGTPNTDQAEKCTSCSFELSPRQKAKFKGTIMMSGVQAPTAQPAATPPAAAPAPAASPPANEGPAVFTPASHAPVAAGARAAPKNLAFEKTMMGPMAPPGAAPATPPAAAVDLGRAATLQQHSPGFQQPAAPASAFQQPQAPAEPSAPSQEIASPAPGGFTGHGLEYADEIPMPPKNNTGRLVAIVCAVLLLGACAILGAIMLAKGEKLFSVADTKEPTSEWRTRIAQSLGNVIEVCKTDCQAAGVYFHPQLKAALTEQVKGLTNTGLDKLADPTQSEARMLDATGDTGLATDLKLDPQQCVRVMSGTAKVVGCSVPESNGKRSMRLIHLEGLASL